MTDSLFSLVRRRIRDAKRTFIETADGRVITYGNAFALAGRLAKALRARH